MISVFYCVYSDFLTFSVEQSLTENLFTHEEKELDLIKGCKFNYLHYFGYEHCSWLFAEEKSQERSTEVSPTFGKYIHVLLQLIIPQSYL